MTGLVSDAPYLNCPRCGLSITLKTHWLAIKHCPRCLGRHRTLVEMFRSPLPADALYANTSLPNPAPRPRVDSRTVARRRADARTRRKPAQPSKTVEHLAEPPLSH
jgi:hypothetical protein